MTKEQHRRIIAEELWLRYFNDVLFDKGLISKDEYLRMIRRIQEETEHKKKRATVVQSGAKDK